LEILRKKRKAREKKDRQINTGRKKERQKNRERKKKEKK